MRYDAFISYRHSDLDMYVAKSLHKGLETFKVPRMATGKTGKKKIERVFRDQEELPIGSDLGDNIRKALEESEFLIVVCSPRTPESYWVQKEIDTYISLHGRDHILAVLIEGEPAESFPKQLLTDDSGNPVEPLAADIRGESRHAMRKKLRTELLRLAAPLLGCSYDDLRQRHRERRMRKALGASGAVAVLALAFGAYSVYNAMMIQENYEGKQRNQSLYLADTSLRLLEQGDRVAATLIALAALPGEENDRPYVPSAQYALSQAVHAYTNGSDLLADRLLKHDFPVSDMYENEQGTRAVSVDQGEYVYVWNLEDGSLLQKLAPELDESGYVIPVLGVCLTDEEDLVLVTKQGIRVLDLDGNEIWRAAGETAYSYCSFDAQAKIAACSSLDMVQFYDLSDGTLLGSLENDADTGHFSGTMVFSESAEKFAVNRYPSNEDTTNGEVCVYDFATGESVNYATQRNYIMELAFSADGNLVAASTDLQELSDNAVTSVTAYVEKIDLSFGTSLWSNPFSFLRITMDSASSILKCKSYTEESTGEIQDDVILSVDNHAYIWDSASGSLKVELQIASGIVEILFSTNSRFIYLVGTDGIMHVFNEADGASYSDYAVDMDRPARQVLVQNGVLLVRSYAQPEILVMKYQEGAGMQVAASLEESIRRVDLSTEESCYAIMSGGETREIHFYDAETDEELDSWVPEGGKNITDSLFISDFCYMLIEGYGTLEFYDIHSHEATTWSLEDASYLTSCHVTENCAFAIICERSSYYIVDLQMQQTVVQGDSRERINSAVLSNDGGLLYSSMEDGIVSCTDTATGAATPLSDDWQATRTDLGRTSLALSPDGKWLAVNCRDNYLRILDTGTGELLAKVPFAAQHRCFLSFSEDGRLLMQGDNYIIQAYDISRQKFVYTAVEQHNQIKDVTYATQESIVCIRTSAEMLLLHAEDYEPLAQIEDGALYIPGRAAVFNKNYYTLYRFPYMSLDQLVSEAYTQLGGQELTEQERLQYHVD